MGSGSDRSVREAYAFLRGGVIVGVTGNPHAGACSRYDCEAVTESAVPEWALRDAVWAEHRDAYGRWRRDAAAAAATS
jgi:hypothetical protein